MAPKSKFTVHCSFDKMVPLDQLKPNPDNPNAHPDRQIKILAKMIRETGWRHPITVSKRSGLIVAGHGRLIAAELNEDTAAPVDFQSFESEGEEYQHLLADNRIPEFAKRNRKKVLELIETKIRAEDLDIDLTGYVDLDVKELDLGPEEEPPAAPMAQRETKHQVTIEPADDADAKRIEKILTEAKVKYTIGKVVVSQLPADGLKTYLYVSQKAIRHNKKTGDRKPVVTARNSHGVTYGHVARIDGPSRIVYRPEDPIASGARVFIETHSPVKLA